jgi:hypothetical protein
MPLNFKQLGHTSIPRALYAASKCNSPVSTVLLHSANCIFVSIVYLTTLSVAQTILRSNERMVRE